MCIYNLTILINLIAIKVMNESEIQSTTSDLEAYPRAQEKYASNQQLDLS